MGFPICKMIKKQQYSLFLFHKFCKYPHFKSWVHIEFTFTQDVDLFLVSSLLFSHLVILNAGFWASVQKTGQFLHREGLLDFILPFSIQKIEHISIYFLYFLCFYIKQTKMIYCILGSIIHLSCYQKLKWAHI